MTMEERTWKRLKNPCSKYCENRNSECRLNCQKFKDWQVEHNKLKEEIDKKRDIDITLTKRDMIRGTYKIRRNK